MKKLRNRIPDPLIDDKGFFEKVYEVARKIPYGRITSYGAIARFIGTTGSARMVGWAMNSSHFCKEPVPAHRVVNRLGLLTGKHHFNSTSSMEELLNIEGIEVVNDKIVNFNQHFWDPSVEIFL